MKSLNKTQYDLFIPAAFKDFNKVQFCVTSALKYLRPQPEHIYIVTPAHSSVSSVMGRDIKIVNEQEVINLDKTACKKFNRPEWIYQQLLKLFQNITVNDNYLVVDSDLVFNREFSVFTDGDQPQFFLGIDQNHIPYFNFMNRFMGYGREYPHSFISEVMLFNKSICLEIMRLVGSVEQFYQICIDNIDGSQPPDQQCLIADYEIYGNFVAKYYPSLYKMVHIKTNLSGKYDIWTDEEILELQKRMDSQDYDVFTYHTWI